MRKFDKNGKEIGKCSCGGYDRYEMWECVRGYCGGKLIPIADSVLQDDYGLNDGDWLEERRKV